MFGITRLEVEKRIKTIEMMEKNGDDNQSRFSYYDVLVRTSKISEAMENDKVSAFLLEKIKEADPDTKENCFTALELRNKLPVVLGKPRMLNKLLDGKMDFDEAYRNAKIGDAHQRIKRACKTLSDVEEKELRLLDQNKKNALAQDFRKLRTEVRRIQGILGS